MTSFRFFRFRVLGEGKGIGETPCFPMFVLALFLRYPSLSTFSHGANAEFLMSWETQHRAAVGPTGMTATLTACNDIFLLLSCAYAYPPHHMRASPSVPHKGKDGEGSWGGYSMHALFDRNPTASQPAISCHCLAASLDSFLCHGRHSTET